MNIKEETSSQIFNCIKKSNNILIITHQKPDGDAIGAVFAFSDYLDSIKKDYKIFSNTDIAHQYDFLGFNSNIINNIDLINLESFDCIIVLDSGDLYYTGLEELIKNVKEKLTIINIDHHETNDFFGDINYIDVNCASTTEILYKLFLKHNIPFSKKIANCLLTGIITDTGTFTNGATTLKSIDVAADLLNYGAHFPKIISKLNGNMSISVLRMWGEVLSRLQKNTEYDMAIVVISENDFKKYNLSSEVVDGLANFLNNLSGVKASLVLREVGNNKIKGSFRTTRSDLDLSVLASFLGGGGHRKSAGFTINGKLVNKENNWQII